MPQLKVLSPTKVRSSVAFTDFAGNAADPPLGLTVTWKDGSGAENTYTYGVDLEVVKDGVGFYHMDLLLSTTGSWWSIWKGIDYVTGQGNVSVGASQI